MSARPAGRRSPAQQARFDAATARAQQVALDRHRRIENARIERLERRVIDNFIADVATYVGARA